MTYSTEWANVQPRLMGYDEQLELPTVVIHNKTESVAPDKPVAWTWEGALNELTRYCPDGVAVYGHESPGTPVALYRHKAAGDAHGIHLSKLLRQYDESPSSALWSEIQSVAREVLR